MSTKNSPPPPKTLRPNVRTVALLDSVRGRELLRLSELGLIAVRHGITPKGVRVLEVFE